MHFTLSILCTVLASTFVQSAPSAALDAALLLKNGQDAQKLNAQFQNIKATDVCTNGDPAVCVGNAIAKCVNERLDTSTGRCSKSQSCFAIPNVRTEGTVLLCTSEKSALSVISSTGATGDVTGKNVSNPGGTPTPAASKTDEVDRITVTVTLTPVATAVSSTRTLSPEEASSVLLSILAGAIPTPSTISSVQPAITSSPAGSVSNTLSSNTQPTATQITGFSSASLTLPGSGGAVATPCPPPARGFNCAALI